MTSREFLAFVRGRCEKHGVEFVAKQTEDVATRGEIKCSGYFDEEKLVLCMDRSPRRWVRALAHEYSHLWQYVHKTKAWVECDDAEDIIDRWIGGEEFPMHKILDCMQRTIACELEAEKKAVTIMKAYKLPVNIDRYIRGANSYLYFYLWAVIRREWYVQANPDAADQVVRTLPNKFQPHYKTISPELMSLFDRYCGKPKRRR